MPHEDGHAARGWACRKRMDGLGDQVFHVLVVVLGRVVPFVCIVGSEHIDHIVGLHVCSINVERQVDGVAAGRGETVTKQGG